MKVFENKEITLKDMPYSYKRLAMNALEASANGLTMREIRLRLKAIAKIENMEESVSLSDEEMNTLKECVETCQWVAVSKEIVEFGDYVASISE